MAERTPVALTVAGSDSGGGAGVQADLKAFAAAGVHGATAITAITVQNTVEVRRVVPVAPDVIVAQVSAVVDDLGVDAVKVGMLGDAGTAAAVGEALALLPAGIPVVLDPVMVAESGARLLDAAALDAVVAHVLRRCTVATPNLPEAQVLADAPEETDPVVLGRAILARGAGAVVVTGGHREEAADVLVAPGGEPLVLGGAREPDGAAHGSGCTHSSTLAALLARGLPLGEAAAVARRTAGAAVARGLRDVGAGAGPVDVLDLAARRRA